MKQEEINRRTKEAVDYLVQSLDSGRSEVLVQYLAAIGGSTTIVSGTLC